MDRRGANPHRVPPAWLRRSTTWIGLHLTAMLPMTRPLLGELLSRVSNREVVLCAARNPHPRLHVTALHHRSYPRMRSRSG